MGDKDNMSPPIGNMGKYFQDVLQSLVNWDESLRIHTGKVLSFLLHRLLVSILPWMRTSGTPDNEFGIDL